jgi:conjugal transfer/type IV secretion protein DotA/TraY
VASLRASLRPGWLISSVVFFVLALWTVLGHAQSSGPVTPDQLMNAANNGGNDASINILTGALGDFFTHPLSTMGGSSTVLGSLFVIFNGCIFCISVVWGSYGIGRGILSSAHEGQVLGQRMNAVWMPIRMVTGLVGSVPIFGGYNGFQVLVVLSATLGIGMANLMWTGAISAVSQFQAIVAPTAGTNTTGISAREAAYGMFQTEVCREAVAKQQADADDVSFYDKLIPISTGASLANFQFGSLWAPELCGGVALAKVSSPRSSSSMLGFRVASVDYDAIAARVQSAYTSSFQTLQQQVTQLASTWMSGRDAALTSGGTMPDVPTDALDSAAINFSTSMAAQATQAQNSGTSALTDSAMQTMRSEGWASAGAWYATFAEGNSAISDAVRSVSFEVHDPSAQSMDSLGMANEAIAALRKGISAKSGQSPGSSSDKDSSGFAAVKAWIGAKIGAPTGNWSVGQWIVNGSIGGLTDDGHVNPIIMFKNMGDYLMTFSETIYGAVAAFKVSGVGKAAEALGNSSLAKAIPGVSSVSDAASIISGLLSVLLMVAGAFLFIGTVMSVYIPLVPYLTWMGALIQYFVVVVEGLVAAGIGALSHMEAEGEGMGQRTERFYIFLLNATARPALMLLGFFMASALVVLIGSFQVKMFASAIANSQGNSMTGLVSIVALLIIFLMGFWFLIQGLFNMVHLMPDQVLGYMGAGHSSELGRDQEGKIHGLFLNFTRGTGAIAGGLLKGGGK